MSERTSMIVAAVTVVVGFSLMMVYANNNPTAVQPVDPNTVMMEFINYTEFGTPHGGVRVEVFAEVQPVYGLPDANVPGYEVLYVFATGQSGKVVATRILREEQQQ